MTLTVLYFAAVRDLVGEDAETLTAEPGTTVAELAAMIEAKHPALAGAWSSVRFARNEAFVSRDERLADGDVVALIPPVAGG